MKISNAFTLEEVQAILDKYETIPEKEDFKYYVNEVSTTSGEHGYYASAFIVGIHNRHTHFSISELKQYVATQAAI